MSRDIIERLMDFERCGLDAGDRVNMRECAAIEIHNLRQEIGRLKHALFEATYWDGKSQIESLHQLSAAVDLARKNSQ